MKEYVLTRNDNKVEQMLKIANLIVKMEEKINNIKIVVQKC